MANRAFSIISTTILISLSQLCGNSNIEKREMTKNYANRILFKQRMRTQNKLNTNTWEKNKQHFLCIHFVSPYS